MEKEIIKYPDTHDVIFAEHTPTRFPSHWHNAAEFTLVLKGGGKYKIGDTIYKPESGDIILVWPHELHEIINVPQGSSVFVQFSSRLIENNSDLVSASGFLKNYHLISSKKEPELAGSITETIYKIRDTLKSKQYFTETSAKILIYEMLLKIGSHVMQEHREQIGDSKFSDKSWNYIKNACSFIADHSAEDISQAEVASIVGLSSYYFSKLFNEYTNMTFPTYLSMVRVQNAINLLEDSSLSITECAFAAGFQSTTTFNKLFREMTGYSPREYRKRLQ